MKKFILVLGLLGFAAPAFAQTPDFTAVDADANGSVTMEEGAAAGFNWSEEDFKAADTDGNGTLSAEEYAAATGQ